MKKYILFLAILMSFPIYAGKKTCTISYEGVQRGIGVDYNLYCKGEVIPGAGTYVENGGFRMVSGDGENCYVSINKITGDGGKVWHIENTNQFHSVHIRDYRDNSGLKWINMEEVLTTTYDN